jgi:hypothetical protein
VIYRDFKFFTVEVEVRQEAHALHSTIRLLWRLTSPRGRRYSIGMVRRGDLSTGGAVLNAAQKGKPYSFL